MIALGVTLIAVQNVAMYPSYIENSPLRSQLWACATSIADLYGEAYYLMDEGRSLRGWSRGRRSSCTCKSLSLCRARSALANQNIVSSHATPLPVASFCNRLLRDARCVHARDLPDKSANRAEAFNLPAQARRRPREPDTGSIIAKAVRSTIALPVLRLSDQNASQQNAPYSITLSARPSSAFGTTRPSVFAVLD